MNYNPQRDGERRTDGHSVRIALLESADIAVKGSLSSIHRRLSEQDDKFDKGVGAIMDRIDEHERARELVCREQADRLSKIETSTTWLERWEAAGWAAIMALAGLFYHHTTKGR